MKNPIVAMTGSIAAVWFGGICDVTFRVDATRSACEAVKTWMQELSVALICFVVVLTIASVVVNS